MTSALQKQLEYEARDKSLAEAIKLAAKDMRQYLRCCPSCQHFNHTEEICQPAGRRPPANVIAFGCEKFEYGIPF